MLGALLPGSAFLAAGRRFVGFALLTVTGMGVMLVAGVLLVERDPAMIAAQLVSRPNLLLLLGFTVLLAALVWVVVIITGHLAVRPAHASGWQRGVGVALVAVLCAGVLVPSGIASRYAFATHGFVSDVFAPNQVDASGEEIVVIREDPWKDRPRVNILLLGGDAGDDRTGLRTDTVIVASIDTTTGDTVLLSLPRNLMNVPFPADNPLHDVYPDGYDCGNYCLLNAVYLEAFNYADRFPSNVEDPGLESVQDSVSEILGLEVDFFVLVDLLGFEQMIDALGGIDIDVGPERVPIGGLGADGLPQPEWRIEEWIEPGFQHLDGYQTLWFARDRASGEASDYMRMRRQRCVLNAIVDQADPTTVVANYLDIVSAAESIITTNIPAPLFPALLELSDRVKSRPIRSLPFTNEVIVPSNPDFDEIRRLVQAALEPPAAAPPTSTTGPTSAAPTTTTPDETTSPSPTQTRDPGEAVATDLVC